MKVLVTGASGMIGSAVLRTLKSRGHAVIAAGRHPVEGASFLHADFQATPAAAWWAPHLAGVDAVVNAVGILQEGRGQTFAALHEQAPIELFHACAMAGVRRVVQVSALGADDGARSAYHLTKRAADDALRALPLSGVIVQPSLVFSPAGGSARLFQRLAVLPALLLPRSDPVLQPVHLQDVVDGIVRLVEQPAAGIRTFAFTGAQTLRTSAYLATLRRALGSEGRPWLAYLPDRLFETLGRVAGLVPGSSIDAATVGMLLRGNAADEAPFTALLQRAPRAPADFIEPEHGPALRDAAVLDWTVPALRWSVAAMWVWTALVSAGLYPREASLRLLADFGLHGPAAHAALWTGVLLDLSLGIACAIARGRVLAWVWLMQLLLVAGYTLLISLRIPEWWLHPFGPVSKNLPLLATIVLLCALARRR